MSKLTRYLKRRNSFNCNSLILLSGLHAVFIVVFHKVTAFAPDESNYIGVFKNLYRSDFSLDGYLGWQQGSVTVLRIMYLPAKFLELLGFSDFLAVRLLSVLYSLISLHLLLKLAPDARLLGKPVRFWLVIAYIFPTIFLWTSLGLRESFIFFSLISTFYLIARAETEKFARTSVLLIMAGIVFYVSKTYLYLLFLTCIVTSALILWVMKKSIAPRQVKLLTFLLVPLLVFPSIVPIWQSLFQH